ncbi:protein argonaute-2 [Rothia dentocariosa]|uniref:protein argonaute-2 n=3 Tax=Rothia dentocariosa TaxID=2047 RepID=UPI000C7CA811|nr:protein argonaute-2 [Rothia dentocariosa]
MEFMMAFRYSRPAMTGAAIFTLAGVTVLPLAQANAAPVSPQGEGTNSASQNAQGQQQGANANAQGQQAQGATQDQQQGANASGQNQDGATQGGAAQDQQGANASNQSQNGATQGGATQDPSQAASGGEQQQAQPGATQDQQAQGAPASQSSSNSNSASQNNQSRQSQPSAPANQNSGFIAITSVDGFIDPQNTDNVLSVETTGIDNTHRVQYEPRVQELDEFGNIVNDDVSNGGGSSLGSDGSFGMYVSVDGTKINPNHHYRVYIDVFDQDTLTASYAYYPIVVWNRTYIPVVPLSAAQ